MKDFKLDNEPKITSGFSTPEDYFNTISAKISDRLSKDEPKIISLFSALKKWHYAAAAIIIFTISVPYYIIFSTNDQDIENSVLENYIWYQSTISQDEIVNFIAQEDLETKKIELSVQDQEIQDTL